MHRNLSKLSMSLIPLLNPKTLVYAKLNRSMMHPIAKTVEIRTMFQARKMSTVLPHKITCLGGAGKSDADSADAGKTSKMMGARIDYAYGELDFYMMGPIFYNGLFWKVTKVNRVCVPDESDDPESWKDVYFIVQLWNGDEDGYVNVRFNLEDGRAGVVVADVG